jgi:hypothetical protein
MNPTRTYSQNLHCLYDNPEPASPQYPGYSIFRAISSQSVEQQPTELPHVHDFAVIWDDDHDTRIIKLLEEMLFAGLLPGVQFIGEHKGELNVILAARTFFCIQEDTYRDRLTALSAVTGDSWFVRVGMIDMSQASRTTHHQCDYVNLLGMTFHLADAFFVTLDNMWQLGTKRWIGIEEKSRKRDEPVQPDSLSNLFARERYAISG